MTPRSEGDGRPGTPLCAGDRLPSLAHLRAVDGGRAGWRPQGRDSIIVVLLSENHSEATDRYVEALEAARHEFELWNARVVVVAPAPMIEMGAGAIAPAGDAIPVLVDEGDTLRARCRISSGDSAVFIADRYGEIFHAAAVNSAARLPDPDTIQDWVKYLATQCAECGVPDESGYGEWA